MDAKKFLEEKYRMCQSIKCSECEAYGDTCMMYPTPQSADKMVDIVEKWSKEHPKMKKITLRVPEHITNAGLFEFIFERKIKSVGEQHSKHFKIVDDVVDSVETLDDWLDEEYEYSEED